MIDAVLAIVGLFVVVCCNMHARVLDPLQRGQFARPSVATSPILTLGFGVLAQHTIRSFTIVALPTALSPLPTASRLAFLLDAASTKLRTRTRLHRSSSARSPYTGRKVQRLDMGHGYLNSHFESSQGVQRTYHTTSSPQSSSSPCVVASVPRSSSILSLISPPLPRYPAASSYNLVHASHEYYHPPTTRL